MTRVHVCPPKPGIWPMPFQQTFAIHFESPRNSLRSSFHGRPHCVPGPRLSWILVDSDSRWFQVEIPRHFCWNWLKTAPTSSQLRGWSPAGTSDIGTCLHEVFPRDDGGLLGWKSAPNLGPDRPWRQRGKPDPIPMEFEFGNPNHPNHCPCSCWTSFLNVSNPAWHIFRHVSHWLWEKRISPQYRATLIEHMVTPCHTYEHMAWVHSPKALVGYWHTRNWRPSWDKWHMTCPWSRVTAWVGGRETLMLA